MGAIIGKLAALRRQDEVIRFRAQPTWPVEVIMNRTIRIALVSILTSLTFPGASFAGESPPFGPPKPPVAAWQFCYALGACMAKVQ